MSTLSDRAVKARLILDRANQARLNLSVSVERIQTRIDAIERREALRKAIAANKADKANMKDKRIVELQESRIRCFNFMQETHIKRPEQATYRDNLKAAIERDAEAVAEAQARIIIYVDPRI